MAELAGIEGASGSGYAQVLLDTSVVVDHDIVDPASRTAGRSSRASLVAVVTV